MKKEKPAITAILAVLCLPLFGSTAWANSSWVWISETRPVDVLPWVVVITLLIETLAIGAALGWKQTGKVFLVVCGANLISFLLPYLIMAAADMPVAGSFLQALNKHANHWPSWIVGIGYLALTILAEFPMEYYIFAQKAEKPRRLLCAVVGANVLTTAVTFAAERLLCRGRW